MGSCEKQVFIHKPASTRDWNSHKIIHKKNPFSRECFFLTGPLYSYNAKFTTLRAFDGVWHFREKVPVKIPDNQADKIHPAGRLV